VGAITKTPYFSWKIGKLPKSCKLSAEGKELTIFISGSDTNGYSSFFSEQKKELSFANERKILFDKDILEEAKLCSAEGACITGENPLLKFDRVVKYIEMLKDEFGKNFHIHLCCPVSQVSDSRLSKLAKIGLDELHFFGYIIN